MARIIREGEKPGTWVAAYWHPYEGSKTEVVEATSYEDARSEAKSIERRLYEALEFPWESWWG